MTLNPYIRAAPLVYLFKHGIINLLKCIGIFREIFTFKYSVGHVNAACTHTPINIARILINIILAVQRTVSAP